MHENRVVSDNQNPRFHIFSIPFFLGVDAEPKEDRITKGLTLILPLEFAHSQQIFCATNYEHPLFYLQFHHSYYTRSTLCGGPQVVLAATLRIGEASRAAASAAVGWES